MAGEPDHLASQGGCKMTGMAYRYNVTVKELRDGQFYARCNASEVGMVDATAPTRQEALQLLEAEMRFRLEFCPCSGIQTDIVLTVV